MTHRIPNPLREAPSSAIALEVDGLLVTLRPASAAELLPLRHAELRAGLPVAEAMFEGDDAPQTRHFGAFAPRSEPIGCASFMRADWEGEPAYQLRGMATRRDLAQRGIGSALLRLGVERVRIETGVARLWCNARLHAAGFYARQGWSVVSEPFDIPTAGPHVKMLFRVSGPRPD